MNPLSNTIRTVAGVTVIGNAGETVLDQFFRLQLLLTTGKTDVDDMKPFDDTLFARELRPFNHIPARDVSIKEGTGIIPAFRDNFGAVVPQDTAALKSTLSLTTRNIWMPVNQRYHNFAFVVFHMYPNNRGWKHGFFVRGNDIIITER